MKKMEEWMFGPFLKLNYASLEEVFINFTHILPKSDNESDHSNKFVYSFTTYFDQ